MSNISVKMDMLSKHVHFFHGIWFHIKGQSRQKVETWNLRPFASASPSRVEFPDPIYPEPLCVIAPLNRPVASGETISARTDMAPADWPAMVTRPGSPPNAEILSLIHFNAATWSSIP